jgi:hypothetical protein
VNAYILRDVSVVSVSIVVPQVQRMSLAWVIYSNGLYFVPVE